MEVSVRLPRVLNADGTERCRLRPTALSLQLQLIGTSSAQMTLTEQDADLSMHDLVELYTAAGSAGLYRVTSIQRTYTQERVITLLHAIDTLSDSVWAAQMDYSGTVPAYLAQIMAQQKARKWQLGTCQDSGAWKHSGINYDRLSDLYSELLGERDGFYPAYNFATSPWTLQYLALPAAAAAEFRLSRNVRSCQITRSDADLCTRLYLSVSTTTDQVITGYTEEDLDGRTPADAGDGTVKLTDTHVTTYNNAAAQAIYGIVEKTADIDSEDVADPAAWAQKFLADRAQPSVQITIDGDELAALTGETWDALSLGKLCRVALADYGETFNERVVAISYPDALGEPTHVTVELANRLPKFSSAISSVKASTASATATAKKASRGGGSSTRDQEHWSMIVKKAVESLDGTGLTQLYESGIDMDAQGGVKIFSLGQGFQSEYAAITVNRQQITAEVQRATEAEGTMNSRITQTAEKIEAEVTRATAAEGEIGSRITETAESIRSDVYAANSQLYSTIEQTASSISSTIEDTENGLYSYIQQTASGLRQQFTSTSNRTIVNDTDPRSATYAPKEGDIWIESTYQGSWDGAEGFDWEHDEDYDWTQVQGAKVWVWKNDRWQLAADRQQLVNYSDFVNTAEILISQKITELANDEGQLEVYRSLLEQTGQQIRAEVYSATSDIYSSIAQTASNLHISLGGGARVVTQDGIKDGEPRFVDDQGNIRVGEDGYVLRDGDIWINSANQGSWDEALEWNWEDNNNYNWSDLRDDEIRVWDAKSQEWKEVVNGRVFTDRIDLDIANDHIIANMRSIDAVDKKNEENMHQLSITTEELRSTFNDRITGVNSELRQTKNDLTSLQAETIRTSQWQTWYEGTGIFQNRENINAVAGKFKVDANGNVHVIDGSGLYLGEENASLAVYTSGNLTAGIIVDKINGGSVKITGAHVDVTARDRATWGVYDADTLTAGVIVNKINGGTVKIAARQIDLSSDVTFGSNIRADGYITCSNLYIDDASVANYTIAGGRASTDSSGVTTIYYTDMNGAERELANFNIADTKTYKDGVSAAKNSVYVTKTWEDNVCTCNPSEGTGLGKTITISQTTDNPTTAAPNLYRVTIKDGDTQVLYFTVDATARYNAGETAGYNSGYADGVNDGNATGQAAFSAKSYTRYGTLAYYDDSRDKYVSAGYGYWFLSSYRTMYEKTS